MRQLNVSIGLIVQDGAYLLQQRGADPKIGAAGKIGAFGGKIEDGETPVKAVCRELGEETSLKPRMEDFTHTASYNVHSDHKLQQVDVHIEAFEIKIGDDEQVRAIEGEVVKLAADKIKNSLGQMTPATKYYFEKVKGV